MQHSARLAVVALVFIASCGAPTTASNRPSGWMVATGTRTTTPFGMGRPTPGGNETVPPEPPPGQPVASGSRTNPPPSGTTTPDGRGAAQVAYDTNLQELVLFGGDGPNGPIGDTWIWKNGHWSWVQTDIAPSPRQGAAFIYDPVRHVSVLFGGASIGGWGDPLGDTWTFDGTHWTQLSPAINPYARDFATVAFDTRRGVVVMYGGWTGNGALGDIWDWDGANWSPRSESTAAPALFPLGLAYRSTDDSIVVAGQVAPGAGVSNQVQTWALVGNSWNQSAAPNAAPCLDHYGGSADDVQNDVIVFFGGYCPNSTVLWSGTIWSESTPNPSPAARGNEAGRPAMTYDPDLHSVLLFGGVGNGTYFNDLWAWDGGKWAQVG
jgi:hypothetical protein